MRSAASTRTPTRQMSPAWARAVPRCVRAVARTEISVLLGAPFPLCLASLDCLSQLSTAAKEGSYVGTFRTIRRGLLWSPGRGRGRASAAPLSRERPCLWARAGHAAARHAGLDARAREGPLASRFNADRMAQLNEAKRAAAAVKQRRVDLATANDTERRRRSGEHRAITDFPTDPPCLSTASAAAAARPALAESDWGIPAQPIPTRTAEEVRWDGNELLTCWCPMPQHQAHPNFSHVEDPDYIVFHAPDPTMFRSEATDCKQPTTRPSCGGTANSAPPRTRPARTTT